MKKWEKGSMRLVYQYSKGVRLKISVGSFLLVANSLMVICITYLEKMLIDEVLQEQNRGRLIYVLLLYGGLTIMSMAIGLAGTFVLQRIQTTLRYDMYKRLIRKIYRLTTADFLSEKTGKYLGYFNNDVVSASMIYLYVIPEIILQTVTIAMIVVVISHLNIFFACLSLLGTCGYVYLHNYYGTKIKKAHRKVLGEGSRLIAQLEEGISAAGDIIAHHAVEWKLNRLAEDYEAYISKIKGELEISNRSGLACGLIEWIPKLLLFIAGGIDIVNGRMTIGSVYVIYQYVAKMMASGNSLFVNLLSMRGRTAALERLDQFYSKEEMNMGRVCLTGEIKEVKFVHCGFSYPGYTDKALLDLGVSIPTGKMTAMVGESGCGKSTIIKLLSKMYPVEQGKLLVNQISLNDIRNDDWFHRVAFAFQEAYIFPISIYQNITLGREDISTQDVMEMCKKMMIDDFIRALPRGLQTVIGERGINLSGGQRQRILLVRALLWNAEVLILDEATSAIDRKNEFEIIRNIREIRKGKTTIIISHRISTVKDMDYILAFDRGRLDGAGTHEILMQSSQVYQGLTKTMSENMGINN